MYELDQETIDRIKDCKRHGFPICMEEALLRIFKQPMAERLMEKTVLRSTLTVENLTCAPQLWEIYDEMFDGIANQLGNDVAEIVLCESLREMESKDGCVHCPLYKREVEKKKGIYD